MRACMSMQTIDYSAVSTKKVASRVNGNAICGSAPSKARFKPQRRLVPEACSSLQVCIVRHRRGRRRRTARRRRSRRCNQPGPRPLPNHRRLRQAIAQLLDSPAAQIRASAQSGVPALTLLNAQLRRCFDIRSEGARTPCTMARHASHRSTSRRPAAACVAWPLARAAALLDRPAPAAGIAASPTDVSLPTCLCGSREPFC